MATKTITLTGAEVAVTGLDGAHAHIRNDSTDTIYASKMPGITAGADGVASIPAGQADTIRGISGAVYLLGTGSALIQSDDYVESPFKASTASGGSAVDDVARAAVNTHAGNAEVHVTAAEKAVWNGKAELSDIPTSLPADGGNAETVGEKHASDFAMSNNPCIEGEIKLIRGNATTNVTIFAWEETVRIRNTDLNAESTTYTDLLVTPSGVYTEGIQNGTYLERKNIADGGNASTLETHPASDFVLKSDYDALAARVAALEGGTS